MRDLSAGTMKEACVGGYIDLKALKTRLFVLQIGLSVLFGLATLATTLNANGVLLLQPDQLDLSPGNVLSALPGTLIFLALLGAVPTACHVSY